jgi:hypothetical protein
MKLFWYVVGGLLVAVSVWTGAWRAHVRQAAAEALKQACAREPVNLDPRQYSNCRIRHM